MSQFIVRFVDPTRAECVFEFETAATDPRHIEDLRQLLGALGFQVVHFEVAKRSSGLAGRMHVLEESGAQVTAERRLALQNAILAGVDAQRRSVTESSFPRAEKGGRPRVQLDSEFPH